MKKIYLAGPDVFEPDAISIGEKLKKLASEYGFIGLFPLDNIISTQGAPYEVARAIRDANIKLIESADIVMANLNPFREMITRIREEQHLDADAKSCQDGKIIEDFQLSHNLMMMDQVVAVDAESCLAYIKKQHQAD